MGDLLKHEERHFGSRAYESAGMDDSLRYDAIERGGHSKIRFHFLNRAKRSLGSSLCVTDAFAARPLRLDVSALGFDTRSLRFDGPERDIQFVPRDRTWCLGSSLQAVVRRLRRRKCRLE